MKNQVIIAAAIGLVLGFLSSNFIAPGGFIQNTNFELDFPGGKQMKFSFQNRIIDFSEILNKIFSEPFSKAGTKEWLKSNQQIYELEDPDLLETLEVLPINHALCTGLRQLEDSKKGPFSYIIDTVHIGFPGNVKEGFAWVPQSSNYKGRRIRIKAVGSIDLDCQARYYCTGLEAPRCPSLQISHEDARRLFGDSPLSKTEMALATIMD